jgi:hypothetical protein
MQQPAVAVPTDSSGWQHRSRIRAPASTTEVPPAAGRLVDELPVTTAYGYVYRSLAVAGVVPLAVITETLTCPAACGGEVAVIEVDEDTVYASAGVVPNLTPDTVEKPTPEMVTLVPPAIGPPVRDRDVMVGP